MSSLWTPDGERPVRRDPGPSGTDRSGPAAGPGAGATGAHEGGDPLRSAAEALGLDLDAMSAEEQAQLREELVEMMRARQEAASVPASEVLSGYLMQLFDHVVIYLQAEPPAFAEAATMIEAMRSMLDGVGDRLGENGPVLREALGQAQMVFVQVKNAAAEAAPEG